MRANGTVLHETVEPLEEFGNWMFGEVNDGEKTKDGHASIALRGLGKYNSAIREEANKVDEEYQHEVQLIMLFKHQYEQSKLTQNQYLQLSRMIFNSIMIDLAETAQRRTGLVNNYHEMGTLDTEEGNHARIRRQAIRELAGIGVDYEEAKKVRSQTRDELLVLEAEARKKEEVAESYKAERTKFQLQLDGGTAAADATEKDAQLANADRLFNVYGAGGMAISPTDSATLAVRRGVFQEAKNKVQRLEDAKELTDTQIADAEKVLTQIVKSRMEMEASNVELVSQADITYEAALALFDEYMSGLFPFEQELRTELQTLQSEGRRHVRRINERAQQLAAKLAMPLNEKGEITDLTLGRGRIYEVRTERARQLATKEDAETRLELAAEEIKLMVAPDRGNGRSDRSEIILRKIGDTQ